MFTCVEHTLGIQPTVWVHAYTMYIYNTFNVTYEQGLCVPHSINVFPEVLLLFLFIFNGKLHFGLKYHTRWGEAALISFPMRPFPISKSILCLPAVLSHREEKLWVPASFHPLMQEAAWKSQLFPLRKWDKQLLPTPCKASSPGCSSFLL